MAGGRARYLRANRDKYGKRTAMSPADLSRRGGGCVGRTRVSTSVPARRTRVSTPVGAALPAARRCAVLLMLDDLDIHRGVCCPFSGQKRKKNPRTPTSVFISVIRCASRIEHRGRTGRYQGDHKLPRWIPTSPRSPGRPPRPTERVLSTCGHAISWEDLKSGPDFKCMGVEIRSGPESGMYRRPNME